VIHAKSLAYSASERALLLLRFQHRPRAKVKTNHLPTIRLFPFRSIHGYNSHEGGAAKCAV